MKNGHGNDFMTMLESKGAVPLQTNQELAQQGINQQVALVFQSAELYNDLYRHWVKWAHTQGWAIGSSPDRRLWVAKSEREKDAGTYSPQFDTIGGLFDWLMDNAQD